MSFERVCGEDGTDTTKIINNSDKVVSNGVTDLSGVMPSLDVTPEVQTVDGNRNGKSASEPLLSTADTGSKWTAGDVLEMVAIYLAYFAFAVSLNLLGPALVLLGQRTGVDIVTASTLYTWRGVGALIGCLIWGKVYDTVRPNMIFLGSNLLAALNMAAIPFSCNLAATSALFALQGVTVFGLVIGSSAVVYRKLKQKSGPYLQALHFLFPVAGLIVPQVVDHIDLAVKGYDPIMNVTLAPNGTGLQTASTCSTSASVVYIFLVNAAVHGVDFLLFFIIVVILRRKGDVPPKVNNTNTAQELNIHSPRHIRLLKFMFMLTSFFLGFMEIAVDGLLFTFALGYLKWDPTLSSTLLSVRYAAYCVSRLISIFAPKYITAAGYMGVNNVLNVVASLVMAFALPYSHILIWIVGSLLYVSVASFFGTPILWASEFFPVTGVFSSAYFIGYAVGALSSPPLVALLNSKLGFMCLWYTHAMSAGWMAVLFVIMYLFTKRYMKIHK